VLGSEKSTSVDWMKLHGKTAIRMNEILGKETTSGILVLTEPIYGACRSSWIVKQRSGQKRLHPSPARSALTVRPAEVIEIGSFQMLCCIVIYLTVDDYTSPNH
jgi:hypothetical protein